MLYKYALHLFEHILDPYFLLNFYIIKLYNDIIDYLICNLICFTDETNFIQ